MGICNLHRYLSPFLQRYLSPSVLLNRTRIVGRRVRLLTVPNSAEEFMPFSAESHSRLKGRSCQFSWIVAANFSRSLACDGLRRLFAPR
jgi:hypothetical protein